MKVDIGHMTREETEELLEECINALPEESLYRILVRVLTLDQIEELPSTLKSV